MRRAVPERLITKKVKGFVPVGASPTVALGTGSYRLERSVPFGDAAARAAPWLTVLVIVGAHLLRGTAGWKDFTTSHPTVLHQGGVPSDYHVVRGLHWFNVLIMVLLIRSGVSILADHPRFYWNVHSTPDTGGSGSGDRCRGPTVDREGRLGVGPRSDWPPGRPSHDRARAEVALPRRGRVGRLGAAFVILLFATSQWRRLVPTTLDIVPATLNCAVTYASLALPRGAGGSRYDALQQLMYFAVIFIARAPVPSSRG